MKLSEKKIYDWYIQSAFKKKILRVKFNKNIGERGWKEKKSGINVVILMNSIVQKMYLFCFDSN